MSAMGMVLAVFFLLVLFLGTAMVVSFVLKAVEEFLSHIVIESRQERPGRSLGIGREEGFKRRIGVS